MHRRGADGYDMDFCAFRTLLSFFVFALGIRYGLQVQ